MIKQDWRSEDGIHVTVAVNSKPRYRIIWLFKKKRLMHELDVYAYTFPDDWIKISEEVALLRLS